MKRTGVRRDFKLKQAAGRDRPGYSKAKRRRLTKYLRRLVPLLEQGPPLPARLEMRKETRDFLASVNEWAPWAFSSPSVIHAPAGNLLLGGGGVPPIVIVGDLELGRFRAVEAVA